MAENFEMTPELKKNIGWESPPWTYLVETTGCQAFVRGVGYDDMVYYQSQDAKEAGYRDVPAAPCYLGTPSWIPGVSDPVSSHPMNSTPRMETGLKNVMDGGTEIEYFGDICVGDTLTGRMKIEDLQVKESKKLGKMLIETYAREYTNQNGEAVAVYRLKVIRY